MLVLTLGDLSCRWDDAVLIDRILLGRRWSGSCGYGFVCARSAGDDTCWILERCRPVESENGG